MTSHQYRAFGLSIASDRAIDSLTPYQLDHSQSPDVEIAGGDIAVPGCLVEIDGIGVVVDGDDYFLSIEECGLFCVTGGRKIIISADPRATADQIDLYLLGTVFGVLLHQRGVLPFHCSAVEVEGAAFLLCGDSGAGKSTLGAHFAEHGFRLLGDDLFALTFSAKRGLLAAGGASRVKLWQDTLTHFGRTSSGLSRIPWYQDKFELRLADGGGVDSPPVRAIYHLRLAEGPRQPGISPLRGLEAANSITANIYRRRFADLMGRAPTYLATAARIVAEVPVFTMNRTWGFGHFQVGASALEHHMRQRVAESA